MTLKWLKIYSGIHLLIFFCFKTFTTNAITNQIQSSQFKTILIIVNYRNLEQQQLIATIKKL